MKALVASLVALTVFLGYRIFTLEAEVTQLQTNAAIALLSAEAANDKIGAIAPFFEQDKEAFAKAWLDSENMPLAVFPEEILAPLKRILEEKRTSEASQRIKAESFK